MKLVSFKYASVFALIFIGIIVEKELLSSVISTSKLPETTTAARHENSTRYNSSNDDSNDNNQRNLSFGNNQTNHHHNSSIINQVHDYNHSNSTIQHSRVRFRYIQDYFTNKTIRNFHSSTTVDGKSLPGPFYDDTIFLLGVRLTTSYEQSDSQVHVDVFGFPGDFVGKNENRFCKINKDDSSNRWENLTKYTTAQMRKNTMIFCQLECQQQPNYHNHRNESLFDSIHNHHDCGHPIPMILIPLESGDGNQNQNSLIWRCNVTDHLNKASILRHSQTQLSNHQHQLSTSVRVSLFWNDTSTNDFTNRITPTKFTQIDIPLYTGVVGYAGAQIRPKNDKMGYFGASHLQSSSSSSSSIRVGMCVSLFQSRPAIYLPEFLVHHINIGIDQFLIGIAVELDSTEMAIVEDIIRPYMEKGFVVLQAFGLTDYFPGCSTDQIKLQFYHQCLYYFKGLTKYVVSWDVDEYWIPPDRLEISGYDNFTIHREGPKEVLSEINETLSKAIDESNFINQTYIYQSAMSSYPSIVTKDKLWKESNYSKSISIHDVIQAMEVYQKRHGCEDKWCYYLFPSYLVGIKPNMKRSNLIGDDFLYREAKSNLVWKKGLVQTRFAMMNGFHMAGSCTFPEDPDLYFYLAKDTHCYPISMVDGEFGSIHHFISLMSFRDYQNMLTSEKDGAQKDEYVIRFSKTIMEQLKAENRTPPLSI
jgi:hypothetical protein